MENTIFNGLNANALLEKIIAKEEEFKKNGALDLGFVSDGMRLPHDELIELLNKGYAKAIPYLERDAIKRAKASKSDDERIDCESEIAFWNTLTYMVCEHFYELGELNYESHLAYMLLSGVGCSKDTERGMKLSVLEMERTASSLVGEARDTALEFIESRRQKGREREAKIAKAIFDGNRAELDAQLDIARSKGDEKEIMVGASSLMHCARHYAMHK